MTTETPNTGRSFKEWIRYIWDEGLARHVIIEKASEGKRAVNLPLTFVLVGGVLAPWLLALGVIVAVLRGYGIRVQGGGEPASEEPIKDTAGDVAEEAQSILDEAADDTADLVEDIGERAQGAADSVEDTVEEAVTGIESKIEGEDQR